MFNRQKLDRISLVLLALLLFFIAGPCLLLPSPLQRWACAQFWDASDRWDTIKAFAVLGLVLFVPLIVFWPLFAAAWQHLAWLGPASLTNWWVRSFLMLFLFPSATLLLERVDPHTPARPRRVKQREEQPTSSAPEQAPTTITHPPRRTRKSMASTHASRVPSRSVQRPITLLSSRRSQGQPSPERSGGEKRRGGKPQPRKTAHRPQADLLPPVPSQSPVDWNEGEGTYREKP